MMKGLKSLKWQKTGTSMSVIWWDMEYRLSDFKYHSFGVAKLQGSQRFGPYNKDSVK